MSGDLPFGEARESLLLSYLTVSSGSIAPVRFRSVRTLIAYSRGLTPAIIDGLLWRSLATLATSRNVCCALRPVIAGVIFFGHGWPEVAELGPMATAEFSQPVTGGASCHARRYYL